jgi:hypothetical protein
MYMAEHAGQEDVILDMEAEVDMDVDGEVVQPVAQPAEHTIAEHLERLDSAGTLDTTQLLRYAEWGELELSPTDVEVCKFLRSVEIGGGASDAASRASLDYARSLGGRGSLLPKTVRTCWKKVQQASSCCHHYLHSPL